eukprot:3384112-Pleurochrysis_carterae.AAC.1
MPGALLVANAVKHLLHGRGVVILLPANSDSVLAVHVVVNRTGGLKWAPVDDATAKALQASAAGLDSARREAPSVAIVEDLLWDHPDQVVHCKQSKN